MVSSSTNNVTILRKSPKCPNMANKPHYEVSESTETISSYCEKYTEQIKYKEAWYNIKDTDILVKEEKNQEFNVFAIP